MSAVATAKDAEEGLDVGVGAGVAVAVKVRAAAGRAAGTAEASKEGFDIGVGARITITVEVGGAARERAAQRETGRQHEAPHEVTGGRDPDIARCAIHADAAKVADAGRERVLSDERAVGSEFGDRRLIAAHDEEVSVAGDF